MYMPNLQTCTFWCDWPMKSRYASHGFNFTCQCWKIPLFHIHAGCRCVWRWSCTLIHRSLLFLWPTRTNPQVSTLIRVVSYLFRAHRMANIDIYMLESFFFFGHICHIYMYAAYIGQTAGLWIDLHPQPSPIPTRSNFAAGSQAPARAWGFASLR